MNGSAFNTSAATFDYHVSRVIAACRAAIVGVYFIWVMIDGDAPMQQWAPALYALYAYFFYTLAVLVISFSSWWLDFLLQRVTLVVDCLIFFAHVWVVLTTHTAIVTPFMGFYCFIVLSAAYRWRWQVSVAVAVFLAIGYFAISIYLLYEGEVNHYVRIGRRGLYMFVLSGLLVWFAVQRRGIAVQKLTITPNAETPIDQALTFALDQSHAQGAAMCWASEDEPYRRLYRKGSLGTKAIALDPGAVQDDARSDTLIFDKPRRRMLRIADDGRVATATLDESASLVGVMSVEQGIAVPLTGVTGNGQLVLTGIAGMTSDDGVRATAIGAEVARALDQQELASLASDTALMRARSALARDLHDSVAQMLAGTRFRLQSLNRALGDGAVSDPRLELETLDAALRDEQTLVRDIIDRLRRNEVTPGSKSLQPELVALAESLSNRWGIAVKVDLVGDAPMVPTVLVYELQQLVREAVANAVRHGEASTVVIAVTRSGGQLNLSITDNGKGFAEMAKVRPRSISERVASLGGTIGVFSRSGETRIDLILPLKGQP